MKSSTLPTRMLRFRLVHSTIAAAAMLLLLGLADRIHAAVLINVDVNGNNSSQTQTGAAAIGVPGDTWNGINMNGFASYPTTDASLVDSSNTATTVGITLSGTKGTGPTNPGTGFAGSGGSNNLIDAGTLLLMEDHLLVYNGFGGQNFGASLTASFSGLNAYAGSTFELVVYSAGNTANTDIRGASITLAGNVSGGNTGSALQTTGLSRQISAGTGVAYQVFTGTITGDTLTITATALPSTAGRASYVYLQGLQLEITPVPEPGTVGMLFFGGLGMFLTRRSYKLKS